jgi:hypothetical protein
MINHLCAEFAYVKLYDIQDFFFDKITFPNSERNQKICCTAWDSFGSRLVRINIAVTFASVLIKWSLVYPPLSGVGVKGFLGTDGNQWLCADRMDVNVKNRYTRHLVRAFAYRM